MGRRLPNLLRAAAIALCLLGLGSGWRAVSLRSQAEQSRRSGESHGARVVAELSADAWSDHLQALDSRRSLTVASWRAGELACVAFALALLSGFAGYTLKVVTAESEPSGPLRSPSPPAAHAS